MAANMTVSSRHASWKEFHLSKKKATKGFLNKTMEFDDSLDEKDPLSACLNNFFSLLKTINLFRGECFLLSPNRGNCVNLVHSCFKDATETGRGCRISSPFKRANIASKQRCISTRPG